VWINKTTDKTFPYFPFHGSLKKQKKRSQIFNTRFGFFDNVCCQVMMTMRERKHKEITTKVVVRVTSNESECRFVRICSYIYKKECRAGWAVVGDGSRVGWYINK